MLAVAESNIDQEIEQLLAEDRAKSLLRFTTAGSVDDGKSTLIGRLLYDSKNVFEDHIRSVAKASIGRGNGLLDLSLLTDGLRAEREQGITIDVAYRYFSTAKRKFIIADTPGHEQYTRNMATGASTADLAIVLIDARNGVLAQSRRHAYIASLLGIPKIVVAVNKMDLAGFSEAVFQNIENGFRAFLQSVGVAEAYFLPMSALTGDNVVERSAAMPWFDGPSLLEYLETVEVEASPEETRLRFPVQYVIRPNQDFRGYAGQIASGAVRPGEEVLVLPAGRRTRVKSITTWDGELTYAHAPMSVTLTLEDNVDASRGDMLVPASQPPSVARTFEAHVVWMGENPLDTTKPVFIKHASQTVSADVKAVVHRVNIRTLEKEHAGTLQLNDIGVLRIATARPLFFDPYRQNRANGCFAIIDPVTNATAGAGMIIGEVVEAARRDTTIRHALEPVLPAERILRWRHSGAVVPFGDRPEVGNALERELFERGAAVIRLDKLPVAAKALVSAGLLILVPGPAAVSLPADDENAAAAILRDLVQKGVLLDDHWLGEGEGI